MQLRPELDDAEAHRDPDGPAESGNVRSGEHVEHVGGREHKHEVEGEGSEKRLDH